MSQWGDSYTVDVVTVATHLSGPQWAPASPDHPVDLFLLLDTTRSVDETEKFLTSINKEFLGRPYHEWEAYVAYMQDTK